MRLLRRKTDGSFKLVSCDSDDPPPYAILSHTWTDGEVTYNELVAGTAANKAGYVKIRFCVEQAAKDGLEYSWVDTCCINKATNDELSNAINSMFRWYKRASKCYVYLSDVSVPGEVTSAETFPITWEHAFRQSRWFTRGWTLQELLAPATVEFFSRNGKQLGTKISLEREIYEITRIPLSAIRGQPLTEFSIEERMNWSSKRKTTLKEDIVYCLLGIFGVHIPLIYGEGEEYATLRFKEEIQKRSKEKLPEIETTGHLNRVSSIHRCTSAHLALPRVSQDLQPPPATASRFIASRKSLLRFDSLLRNLGFYGHYISRTDESKTELQRQFRFGVCPIEFLGPRGCYGLYISLKVDMRDKIWGFDWGFQTQQRVSADSPLMRACEKGDVTLMKQILEEKKGGINDQIASCGKTPLMVAITSMQFKAVQFLLENKANPNIPDDDQILPIFAVVGMNPRRSQDFEQLPPTWDRWLDALRLLIRYGASTHEIVRGRSLAGLNVARHDTSSKVLPFLRVLAVENALDYDSIANDPTWSVIKNAVKSGTDTVDALKLLRACGVNITRVLADGRTVLHLAAHHCQEDDALSYLLETGCATDIDRQDQWGWTPLHYAVLARTSAEGPRPYSTAAMLIRNGADPSIKGRGNPGSSYEFHSEEFTGLELLKHVRYKRFELLLDVLDAAGVEIGSVTHTDAFYDAEEYYNGGVQSLSYHGRQQ